jgi:oligoribonuclease NrnB/cAMP/cGMP phosphodiesterase (DHH superfamily)
MVDCVITHKDCPDGYSALLVLFSGGCINKKCLILNDVPTADHAPEKAHGYTICADVAYKPLVIEELLEQVERLVFIDHHITNIDEVRAIQKRNPKLEVIYDVNECGSSLTWQWLHPNDPLPKFLEYIKDNDIGRWELPETRSFLTWFETDVGFHYTYSALKELKYLFDDKKLAKLLELGANYYHYRDYVITSNMRYIKILNWGNYKVGFANLSGTLAGEVVTRATKILGVDIGIAFNYHLDSDSWVYSLRAPKLDVGKIAKGFGGGGHRGAAAFRSKLSPKELIKQKLPI